MALDLGGILGAVGAIFGPTAPLVGAPAAVAPAIMTGVSGNGGQQLSAGQGMGGPINSAAIPIISMILDGMNDSAIRTAARTARVGKKAMIETLTGLDVMSGGAAFTGVQKMFLSNEIEKIFKPRRRSAIPKSLRRTVKMIGFLRKELRPILK